MAGTPFDFTSAKAIGRDIGQDDQQLTYGLGYDHNFVLDKAEGEMSLAARVYEPTTGRVLEIRTTEPGIQFYCGNFLDGRLKGKSGKPYVHRGGFCLETQHLSRQPESAGFPLHHSQAGRRIPDHDGLQVLGQVARTYLIHRCFVVSLDSWEP